MEVSIGWNYQIDIEFVLTCFILRVYQSFGWSCLKDILQTRTLRASSARRTLQGRLDTHESYKQRQSIK
jgi:hypothetical protein